MIRDISAVIIVKNGQHTIEQTLRSLASFSEVVVYDNGSTDKTLELAKKFPNVKLVNGIFTGFGPTKNSAANCATNDWIFSLDADEVISAELAIEIEQLTLNPNDIYQILRINFYQQRQVSYCWGNDRLVRLYNRTHTAFNQNKVHEDIEKRELNVVQLKANLLHYPYHSISHFIHKFDQYSDEFAKQHQGKRRSSPLLAISNAIYSFFKTYFLKRAILDGYPGLVIAFSHAATNFYKYMKLYELNRELMAREDEQL